ncbi:hypothetical protein [Thermoleptolyngbya sp.]
MVIAFNIAIAGELFMARQNLKDTKQPPSPKVPATPPAEDFNFDEWAGAVKQQMIASLKRRGSA